MSAMSTKQGCQTFDGTRISPLKEVSGIWYKPRGEISLKPTLMQEKT